LLYLWAIYCLLWCAY